MKKILVIYPGFPHYRKGIIEALDSVETGEYIFVGDKSGYNNIRPYTFNSPNFTHIPSFQWGPVIIAKGLLRYVYNCNCDGALVHSAPYSISITIASLLLKLRGKKVYNWAHGILSSKKSLRNYLYVLYYKFFFSGMLVYSEGARKNLIALGYDPNKIKVIYNSLDYEEQLKFRSSFKLEDARRIKADLFKNPSLPLLLFIGRLTPQKKLGMLIEALQLLHACNEKANLLFVGEGPMKDELMRLSAEMNLEDYITFYGASFNEATNHQLISASDCCVAPGEVGLTAIHSLMYGTPVISHSDSDNQMPEYEAILPGENGELFEKDNVEDLADKIQKVFSLYNNSDKLQVMKRCYGIVDNLYNPKFQVRTIENLPW